MPKVSVISIALSDKDFDQLRNRLALQTYTNFEFIGEVGGSIPEAWNRAIQRAQGEILVFTETDAISVNERWLEELVSHVSNEKVIVKGLEVTSTPWDFSNLAAYRNVFQGTSFDESFLWAEDTEFLCRLHDQGYEFRQINQACVIHLQKYVSRKYIHRAFRYGIYFARLHYRYKKAFETAGFVDLWKMFIKSTLNLAGYFFGKLVYWPERRYRKRY